MDWNPKSERCDRCHAEGVVQIAKGDLKFYLCKHHYKDHMNELVGWEITEQLFTLAN